MNIWFTDRIGNDWGQPKYLDVVNSPAKEGSPTVAKDGTLCFFSDRGRAADSNSIYCSELHQGKYEPPKKLGPEVNSESSDTSPFLSPDGKTLLFYSTRAGGYGHADLYVCFRTKGQWSPSRNLGPVVNTGESEYNPVVSPDGKTLYFGRNGKIYWIAVGLLNISGLDARRLHD
jgi:Tol biopolymer transport system component